MRRREPERGFSLLELLLAMLLGAVLISGATALMGGSAASYRLQLARGQMEESGQFARETLAAHITQAGYHPRPWQANVAAVTSASVQGATIAGDRLGLQRRSPHNCYGNENPARDANGQPSFYLLQTVFRVNAGSNLVMTCRYGPDAAQLTTQINSLGLVEHVESMQVQYAEDRDGDTVADGWVPAGTWADESRLLAIRVALLLASPSASYESDARPITLLDETFAAPADGRLRKVAILTAAIRGRLK